MTSKIRLLDDRYYLFGNRLFTHGVFWVSYYVFFSLLWAEDRAYYQSFGLELVLMPIRILASYTALYVLIPRLLMTDREGQFLLAFAGLVGLGGLLQRILVYYYYELLFSASPAALFDLSQIMRAIVLVNSTVMLLSALKIYQLWKAERGRTQAEHLVIRAEKRNYRVLPDDIYYIEALGNYVTYYMKGDKRLISYSSLKEVERQLPPHFERIHKSFIVNKRHVLSYSHENVEIANRMLPLGKSVEFGF